MHIMLRQSVLACGIAAVIAAPYAGAAHHESTQEKFPATSIDTMGDTKLRSYERLGTTLIWDHQRQVMYDFLKADADRDGMLSVEEYREIAPFRAARFDIEPRDKLTAAEMLGLDKEFKVADRTRDDKLSFHEVYVFETFDRPGMFPTRSESIPQAVSGHWESQTVAKHEPVYHEAPFSPANHKKALEEGGFGAADSNNDGLISVFEASDFSLLSWTGAVRAFAKADRDGSATLTEKEYKNFQSAIAKAPEQDERPGQFPSGRQ